MNVPLHAAIPLMAAAILASGCTSTPTPRSSDHQVGPPVTRQDPACAVSNVASRIPATGTQCSAAGRSYSSDDIDRTGAPTAGRALQLLDPSITVHQ